jgi:hypothetical protein
MSRALERVLLEREIKNIEECLRLWGDDDPKGKAYAEKELENMRTKLKNWSWER